MINSSVSFAAFHHKRIFVASDLVEGSKKMVIMSHGFRGSTIGPARQFVDFSCLLNAQGISTLRFDQPNAGNSEGDYLDSSFTEWVDTTTFFAQQYLKKGYQVALLGQSMGATVSVVASARPELNGKIDALLLWVPDAKTDTGVDPDKIYEEAGQRYYGRFWQEAKQTDFFGCLNQFSQSIHLVYGENDKYVSEKLRQQIMAVVIQKGGEVMVLPGEDHSPWTFDHVQSVMRAEFKMLQSVWH